MIVIIGAGIVGCSAAYYLSKKGWKDIIVLDQGPLFKTGGSTSHAPGLVFQNNSSKTLCQLAQWSVQTYQELTHEGLPCFYSVGSLEVACSPERWDELKLKSGRALSWGLKAELFNSPDLKNALKNGMATKTPSKPPLMNTAQVEGGLYVPSDGVAKAIRIASALAEEAIKEGVTFIGNTQVTGFIKTKNKIQGVVTAQGTIQKTIDCEKVLVCAGIWGPQLGKLAGVPIPLVPVEHQYVITTPLKEWAGETREVVYPILRHQDRSLYFRQHGDCIGIGNYLHEPLVANPETLNREAMRDFTPEHFKEAYLSACQLLPSLKTVDLAERFNGMFSFTPDGFPLIGEALSLQGFWMAEAVWVTHAAGVGRVVSELMSGEPASLDLREMDCNRFMASTCSPAYLRARGAQQYREIYDIIHPLQQIQTPRRLRTSPFFLRHQELGAVFYESSGWERPQYFNSNLHLPTEEQWPTRSGWNARYWSPIIGAEHKATREKVALFDLTAFTKLELKGPGAFEFLNYLSANQIKHRIGGITYTAMLNQNGGIMCDLTVTRWEEDRFWIITGGSVGTHDRAWIMKQMEDKPELQLTDLSSGYCSLGVWGPEARNLLQSVSENDLSHEAFPFYTAQPIYIGSIPCFALRLSYAGELGWEVYAPTEFGLGLWDTLWEAGQAFGVVAAGNGAFDSLRIEKGYRLWGADIHSEYDPIEAGLEFAVKMNKPDFKGKTALANRIDQKKLCCLVLPDSTQIAMGKEPILHHDQVLGYVTSANYGYTTHKSIAYGYLPLEFSKPGTEVSLLSFGKRHSAIVSEESLYDPKNLKLKV